MKVVSFFSGCGGLDLGFEQAGFDVVWANDIDPTVYATYELNHPHTFLCKKDMRLLSPDEIPECDGFIGGPPCQSWSEGGKQRGLDDERGRMFLTYINLIKTKKPKFFVIENVKGILSDKHIKTFMDMLSLLKNAGYVVNYKLLNAINFRIPQERYRVFVVGIRNDIDALYHFPEANDVSVVSLRQAIGDIMESPHEYTHQSVNGHYGKWLNHDVYMGPFDKKYMARNRVRGWDDVSFTIQAQARNCPIHPQAPKMIFISKDKQIFSPGFEYLYRRLSVRECARIQSFPDHFRFIYHNVCDGYKMVGNAVPPRLGKAIANSIKDAFEEKRPHNSSVLVATYRDEAQLKVTLERKVYYVRAGIRAGAMQFPSGMLAPRYLLLHKKENTLLFTLKESEPKMITAQYLEDLGFHPSGDVYWLFELDEGVYGDIAMEIATFVTHHGGMKARPYIVEFYKD